MRLVVLHNRYREPGGEDLVVGAEVGLLRSAGFEVVVHEVANPLTISKTARSVLLSAWNPFAARAVGALVEDLRPEVVHVHNTWYSLSPAVLRAVQKARVPVVMTLHNYRLMCVNALLFRDGQPCELCVGTHPWRGVRYACYRDSRLESAAVAMTISTHRLLGTWERDVDLFLALTEFSRARFVAAGLPAEKVVVKPNFVPDPGDRHASPSGSDRVLFVGRLSREKGVDVLLKAWQVAAPQGLELLVVGDGPMRVELEALAPAGVRFAGRLASSQVRDLMLTSRALAVPSIVFENQPRVEIESMAAGLPLVVSDLGGVAETAGVEGAALKVLAGDVTAWAASLDQLGDGTLVDQTGRLARAQYEKHHTPATALTNLQHIYQSVQTPIESSLG